MQVLITGATGFLGSRIAARVLEEGHEVTAIVREPARLAGALLPRVKIVRADLRNPVTENTGGAFDVLVHAAGEGTIFPSESGLAVAEHGTRHAVEAALAAGVSRVVIISCIEAAGPRRIEEAPVFEDSPPRPATPRGIAWVAGEREAARLCEEAGVPLVVLRMGHLYGEGNPGFIAEIVHDIVTGQPEKLHPDLKNRVWQPLHVEDAVTAVMSALDKGFSIYHVTDGDMHTVANLLEDIEFGAQWRNIPVPPFPVPPPMEASTEAVHFVYVCDRASEDLGYAPAWSFRRGVLDIVDALGLGLPRLEVAEAYGRLNTFLVNTPAGPVNLNRDMGGGMGFVHQNQDRYPPLDLLWMAATLDAKKWPVTVADGSIAPFTPGNLVHLIVTRGIHCVVAEVNLPTFEQDLEFLRRLRKYSSAKIAARTVLTEPHFHGRLLSEGGVDLVIHGECDLTIDQVLIGTDRRGTAWLEGGELRSEAEDRVQDLDSLPLPGRHLLNHEPYAYSLLGPGGFTTVQTSRGCPYSCGYYCPYPLTQGKTWRARSAKHVVDELSVCHAAGLRKILFRDATFTLSRERTLDMCRMILERGLELSWWCETRINCLDEDLLQVMAAAGCKGINFGLESGDDEVLQKGAKQGVDVKRIRKVLAAAELAGIHSHLLVAVGLPHETRRTIARTYELLGELPARSVGCTGITPFPGTELWKDATKSEWLLSTDWSRYGGNDTVMRTDHLGVEDIRFAANMLFEYFQLTRPESIVNPEEIARHQDRMRRWVEDGTLTPA